MNLKIGNCLCQITEAQWNRIKFVFEKRASVGRPSLNPRTVFNALMRDLPARYGNWNSIQYRHQGYDLA